LKIALYLLTEKGYEVLQALVQHKFAPLIEQVIVGSDKQVTKDYANEIIELCQQHQIKYSKRGEDVSVQAPYSMAVSWRWIINQNNSRLIVLHDSLLPKYRGFAPLVNALLNEEPRVGVTALFATDYYDEGEIISQLDMMVDYPVKIKTIIQKIATLYIQLALDICAKIQAGKTIKSTPQNEQEASYSLWRNEADYLIDWNMTANQILNFIYVVSSPYKGAATFIQASKKIRILEASLETDVHIVNRDVGKVIFVKDNLPIIVCGKGLLKITNAVDDQTGKTVLPFDHFRTRLTSYLKP